MNEQNSNNMRAGLGVFLLIIWAIVAIACSVYFLNVGGATAWAALPNFVGHVAGIAIYCQNYLPKLMKPRQSEE